MKRIPSLIFLTLFLTTIFIFFSCKKDQANAPLPVDGLKAYSGKNRAKVEFQVPGDAKTGKVFFGSGNFKEFTVSDPGAVQSVIVEELPENEQMLRVVTINGEGVTSDPRGIRVQVYGSKYESGLTPRKWVDQINNSANSIELKFGAAVSNEVGVRVVFTTTTGTKDSVMISESETAVQVNNIDLEQSNYYYSVFKPNAEAIDEFYSAPMDLKTALLLNFGKENWIIAGASDEEAGKAAELIIDNDAFPSWRSQAGSASPHWVVVDMGNPNLVDGFYYVNHAGNGNGAKDLRFEISDDNTNWTPVLQTEVGESYFRQRLPLTQPVTTRYFKVTVLASRDPGATQTEFAEIDAYNIQNISSENGYTTDNPVELVNAKAPFTGDGSNPFPALGEFRMQKVAGWTHSENAVVSYDGGNFSLFIAPVWGLPPVTNGKVFQTVDVQPGKYVLKIEVGGADGPVDIYGVVAGNGSPSLPDYTTVSTDESTLAYLDLMPWQNKMAELILTVTEASSANIGVVYNIRDQFAGGAGLPWTSIGLKGFELYKVE